jgi:hypothetical protein
MNNYEQLKKKISDDVEILQYICTFIKPVGEGGFGHLYLVSHKKYGSVCAKIIKAADYDSREFDNLEKFVRLSCEYIVRIYGFVVEFLFFFI